MLLRAPRGRAEEDKDKVTASQIDRLTAQLLMKGRTLRKNDANLGGLEVST